MLLTRIPDFCCKRFADRKNSGAGSRSAEEASSSHGGHDGARKVSSRSHYSRGGNRRRGAEPAAAAACARYAAQRLPCFGLQAADDRSTRRRRGDRRSARVFWVWQGLRLASEGFEPRWCGVRTPLRDVFLLAISVSSPKSCPRRVRVFDLVFIFKYTRCRRRYPIIRLCYSGWYSWEIFHPEYFKPY